ncbi:restriction endonuclease subunit S [Parafannyhessea umbonata]|uniref:restriction endonuclease subunit S n=1 Tax=Parafannyhessea umbonata TaxID=604330 RepID=UPI0034C6015A
MQPSENGTEKRYHPQTERQALLNTGIPGRSPLPAATAAAKPPRPPRCQEHLATAGREKSASAPNPTTWEQRKLADVAEIVGGGTPDTNNVEYWDGDIDWYSPAELGTQIYVDGSARRITEAGYANSSAKMLPAGRTILFTSRAGIGTTAILSRPACTNQGFQSIVVGDETDVYFLFSMTDRIKKRAEQKAAGSTFLEVSGKQLAAIELMFPALSEQRKIGSLFQSLDNLITLHQRKQGMFGIRNGAWNGMRKPLALKTPRTASSPFHTPTVARIDEADGADAAVTEVVSSERPFALWDASRTAGCAWGRAHRRRRLRDLTRHRAQPALHRDALQPARGGAQHDQKARTRVLKQKLGRTDRRGTKTARIRKKVRGLSL